MLKTLIISLGLLVALPNVEETFTVDTNASKLNWKAYKVGGKHNGSIKIKSGSLTVDKNEITWWLFYS